MNSVGFEGKTAAAAVSRGFSATDYIIEIQCSPNYCNGVRGRGMGEGKIALTRAAVRCGSLTTMMTTAQVPKRSAIIVVFRSVSVRVNIIIIIGLHG